MDNTVVGHPIHSTDRQRFLQNSKQAVMRKSQVLCRGIGMGGQVNRYGIVQSVRVPNTLEVPEFFMVPQVKSLSRSSHERASSVGSFQVQEIGHVGFGNEQNSYFDQERSWNASW